MNIQDYFAPKATDIEYTQDNLLIISLICRADSYKFSHPFAYPKHKKILAMTSYGEARVGPEVEIVHFGLQMFIKKFLTQRITMKDIDDAEAFAIKHFGRKLFCRETWEKVVTQFNGQIPVVIRALPEGTVVQGGTPLYTVTAFGEDFFWFSSWIETMLQRAVWYPTTIASRGYAIKKSVKKFYEETCDHTDVQFAMNDFSARGVTCSEQAEVGSAAHTVNFSGSVSVEGILAANFYYKEDMAAYFVYATEHSVECSFGPATYQAKQYITHQIEQAPKGSIVSIVLDGYNIYREVEICCDELRDVIINSGVKVVFRPDSGDMMRIVPFILQQQAEAFGYTKNSKGYKKINHVGLIQGDGVDPHTIVELLKVITSIGFAADNIVFGSGGALLQKVNRDTYKFAQKASAILIEDDHGVQYWEGISKAPITDSGKKSKEGVLTTVRLPKKCGFHAKRLDRWASDDEHPALYEDAMQLVYHNGKLYNETTLKEVRARCAV